VSVKVVNKSTHQSRRLHVTILKWILNNLNGGGGLVSWNYEAEVRDQLPGLVNKVMSLVVPLNAMSFLSCSAYVSFPRRNLVRGVRIMSLKISVVSVGKAIPTERSPCVGEVNAHLSG
jgi:hypothetical protein